MSGLQEILIEWECCYGHANSTLCRYESYYGSVAEVVEMFCTDNIQIGDNSCHTCQGLGTFHVYYTYNNLRRAYMVPDSWLEQNNFMLVD